MKKLLTVSFVAACAVSLPLQAASLYFSSGVVSNYSNVTLTIQGPTNLTCQVERLNRTNQSWDSEGTVTLDSSGTATFDTSLCDGTYGFFRTKATNDTYYSTNAFGAVVGTLSAGYSMIGNPFGTVAVSAILPDASTGTTVYKWNNAATNYDTTICISGTWYPSMDVGTADGIMVNQGDTNGLKYIVSGLFTTNQISKSIPKNSSILCSPLYELLTPSTYRIDTLDTNYLGGLSNLPVQTSGADPQCTISVMIDTDANYKTYTLTTNDVWQYNGTNTTIDLHLAEGFWINKPTNATWNVHLTFW